MDTDHDNYELTLSLKGLQKLSGCLKKKLKNNEDSLEIFYRVLKVINDPIYKDKPIVFTLSSQFTKDKKEHFIEINDDDIERL